MSGLPFFPQQPHPNRHLQGAWRCLQWVLAVFAFSPLLALPFLLGLTIEVWRHKYNQICYSRINQGFAVLGGWMAIASLFALNRGEAILGLFNFLPFFFCFAAISLLVQTPAQLQRMAWILVVTSVPVVIIGLGQLYWGWTGPVKILWGLIDWPLDPTGTPPGRMASVFAYANILASYLIVTFILGLGLWIEAGQKSRFTFSPVTFCFLGLAAIANGFALILTNSRNAWAVAILGCLAFALYLGWRWLIAAVAAVASSVLWAAFGLDPSRQWLRRIVPAYFWARLTDELYPDRPIAQLRSTQWQFAWQLSLQRPLTGWGLRNFTPIYEAKMNYWIGHPHNLILMLMAETGIFATLLLCGLVGWILAKAVMLLRHWGRKQQDRLIFFTYLVAFGGCTLFHLLDVTLFDARINFLGWLLLGSICGIVYRRDRYL